ncbi:hypothetical protein JCM10212_002138 [Sporobolomyces blumeae]
MATTGTGISRSLSPQPRSRNVNSSSSTSPDLLARHRTNYHLLQHPASQAPFTPEVGYVADMKGGTAFNGYANGHANGYALNGTAAGAHHAPAFGAPPAPSGPATASAYRPRSPAPYPSHHSDQGTLSSVIASVFRSARSTWSNSHDNSNSPFSGAAGHASPSDAAIPALLTKLRPTGSTSSTSHGPGGGAGGGQAGFAVPSASTVGFVLLCCLWYLSSALSSNTGKSILTRFRYPVTLTFVQFAFVAGYSFVVLALRQQVGGPSGAASGGLTRRRGSMNTLAGLGIRKPTRSMFHGTFMMSLFQIAGHVFSSMAIARVPVSTVHTIKALSPLFTVLSYVALFGVRYSTPTYVSLLPLTVGVMLACSFDLRANAIGFLCALGSTFIFVAQNIFSKKLLPKENHGGPEDAKGLNGSSPSSSGGGAHAKLDKLNLLFYSSGVAFILMIPIWLYSDATALFLSPDVAATSTAKIPDASTASLVFYFFMNGTVHFGQNLLAFSLLARTSPVTYSIASLVKRIAVICIAIVWFGQKVTPIQGFGMTMTFGGLWMYNNSKSDVAKGEKKRIQVEKRMGLELPSNMADARAMDGGGNSSDENVTVMATSSAGPRTSSEYNPYHPSVHSSSSAHAAPPPPPPLAPPPSNGPSRAATGASSTYDSNASGARNRQTSLPSGSASSTTHGEHGAYHPPPPQSSSSAYASHPPYSTGHGAANHPQLQHASTSSPLNAAGFVASSNPIQVGGSAYR